MSKSNHTWEAFKNMKQIGSITNSSGFLARKMTKHIDFSKKLSILELGAGNGAITKEILANLNNSSELHSYEIHKTFAEDLEKINDARLTVCNENVTELSKLNDNSYDVVISSLPLAIFDKVFKKEIFQNVQDKLKPDGLFVQYQYSLLDLRGIEKSFKEKCKLGFCLLNIPPAFVYRVQLSE